MVDNEELFAYSLAKKAYEMAKKGGTTVEANPVETGSEDLNTLKVGDTVYNIPQGGGGEDTSTIDNLTYEGVNLAVKFASEINAAPFNGDEAAWIENRRQTKNYKGINIGDYFEIVREHTTSGMDSKLIMAIAGINTYKGSGDTEIGDHIDFISTHGVDGNRVWNRVDYNNGIGLDKFTGDGSTTTFQLKHRSANTYPSAISSVTLGSTTADASTYSYSASTGVLTFATAPGSGVVIKAAWADADLVKVPFLCSNIYAYLNSEKMGVPNEAAADPTLTEVDYTTTGVWYTLPQRWKNIIKNKRIYAESRYTKGTLRTSPDGGAWCNLGKIWLPHEMEIYGVTVWSDRQRNAMSPRQYQLYRSGRRKFYENSNKTGRAGVWLVEPRSGYSTNVCYVYNSGNADNYYATYGNIRPVVGFRI